VAVVDGSVYTVGSAGEHEQVVAVSEATGALLWRSPIGPAINDAPLMRWLSQRMPTVDGERLFVTTAQSQLICLKTSDGKELWRKDYVREFSPLRRSWGFVDHPLIDDDQLICIPGGKEATIAALNKATGDVQWKCLLDPPEAGSYPSAVLAELAGVKQIVAVLNDSLVGVRAGDGKLLWRYASNGLGSINTLTPIISDRYVILPGGRGNSDLVVFEPKRQGNEFTLSEITRVRANFDHFADATVLLDDQLYAVAYSGLPLCIEWRTGKKLWGPVGTGGRGRVALTYADQRLYLLYSDGTCYLVEPSVAGFRPVGNFKLPDHVLTIGATFPVITGGHMYLRDNDHLFCYDLQANRTEPAPAPRVTKLELPPKGPPTLATSRSATTNKQPDAAFVPTPHDVVARMLELAGLKQSDLVYDLGSGDGRIVVAAAKTFACKAIGVEVDKQLVEQSKENVRTAGVESLVQISQADLFEQDLSRADVVALYLPTNLMDRLLPQLEKLKPGARVISHFFKFTDVSPVKSVQMDSRDDGDRHEIHLWIAPLKKSGN
jgi:outer membrane protein assembly factor BamB/precorrin-6B methylase 2